MAPDASASSTEMDERAFMDSFFGVPRFRASRPEQSSVQLKGDGTTGSRSDSREELAPGALERCDSGDGKQVTVEKAGGEEARTSSADSQGTPSSQARAWDDGLADRLASYIRGLFSHPEGGSSSEHRAEPLKKEHKKQVVAFCRSLWDSKVTSARVLVEPDSTWILSSVYQHCNFAGGLVARTVWDTVRLVYALKWAGQRGHALPEDVIDPVSTLASGVVSLMHQAQWCLQGIAAWEAGRRAAAAQKPRSSKSSAKAHIRKMEAKLRSKRASPQSEDMPMSVRESFFQAIVTFQALAEKVENVLKVLRGLMEKDVVAEEYRWLLEEDEEDEEDAWGGAGEENDAGEDGEGREEGEKKEEGGKVAAVRRGEASGQGEQERKGDDEKGTAGGKGTQAVMVPTSEKEAGDDGGERSGLGVTEEMEKAKKKGEVKMEEVGGEREKEKEKDTNAQEGKEKGDKRDTGNAVMGIGSGEKGKGGKANREDEEVPPTQEGARRASESRDEEAPPKNDESASGAEEGYPNNEEITSDAEAGSAAVPRSQRLPFPVGPDLAALVDSSSGEEVFRIVYELLRLLASAWAQAEDLKSRTAELHKRAQAGEELDTKAWKAALDAKCRGLKSVVLGLQGSIREISRKVPSARSLTQLKPFLDLKKAASAASGAADACIKAIADANARRAKKMKRMNKAQSGAQGGEEAQSGAKRGEEVQSGVAKGERGSAADGDGQEGDEERGSSGAERGGNDGERREGARDSEAGVCGRESADSQGGAGEEGAATTWGRATDSVEPSRPGAAEIQSAEAHAVAGAGGGSTTDDAPSAMRVGDGRTGTGTEPGAPRRGEGARARESGVAREEESAVRLKEMQTAEADVPRGEAATLADPELWRDVYSYSRYDLLVIGAKLREENALRPPKSLIETLVDVELFCLDSMGDLLEAVGAEKPRWGRQRGRNDAGSAARDHDRDGDGRRGRLAGEGETASGREDGDLAPVVEGGDGRGLAGNGVDGEEGVRGGMGGGEGTSGGEIAMLGGEHGGFAGEAARATAEEGHGAAHALRGSMSRLGMLLRQAQELACHPGGPPVGLLTELMWVSQHVLACVSDISLPEPIRKAGMVLAGKALAQVVPPMQQMLQGVAAVSDMLQGGGGPANPGDWGPLSGGQR